MEVTRKKLAEKSLKTFCCYATGRRGQQYVACLIAVVKTHAVRRVEL